MKVATDSVPKPRRRSCLNFIGNCLVMFGGFNSDYYNDLHYVNVAEIHPKPKKLSKLRSGEYALNCKDLADILITASNGKTFHCHKGVFMQHFKSESKLHNFLSQIEGKES